MTPERPLANTGTDVERLLLAAGAEERPDEASVRQAAAVLGIAPGAALVAATLGAGRVVRWTSMASWFAFGSVGLGGLAIVVGMAVVAHGRMATAAVVAPPTAAVRAADVAEVMLGPSPTAMASTEIAARDVAGPVVPAVPPRRHGEPVARGIREQADALDSARAALAGGDARRALARLDEFDRRFPFGNFREEALLLRIEALLREGDRQGAASLADRFLKAFPASVQTDRVASIRRQIREGTAP
jgi:Outer membrane lipoprotein